MGEDDQHSGQQMSLRSAISQQIKQHPRLFDAAKFTLRLSGRSDAIYEELRALHDPVTFLQIGSNDGLVSDPLREFIVHRDWRGAFVEPIPAIFNRLVANYKYVQRGQLCFLNMAVSDAPGMQPIWKIKDCFLSDFPPFACQVSSFSRDHIIKHFQDQPEIDSKLEAVDVPCDTYEGIKAKAGLTAIDLLHLDIEGYEATVFDQMDLACGPKMVLFEVSHMPVEVKEKIYSTLRGCGYNLKDLGLDCVARRGPA